MVTDNTTLNNNVTIGSSLNVIGSTYMTGPIIGVSSLFINGDTELESDLLVNGNTTFVSDVYITKKCIVDGNIKVNGTIMNPNFYPAITHECAEKIFDIWTIRDSFSNILYSTCWSPTLKLFCTVGTNSIITSTDGVNWISRVSPNNNDWRSICWSPDLGIFCAVAINGTTNVMISYNGIDWILITSGNTNAWVSICWSPNLAKFCAVAITGTNNRIMTSDNGITWNLQTTNNSDWSSICWSQELSLFCAISETNGQVMTSTNGIVWTTYSINANIEYNSICWSPDLDIFCAVGDNSIITSNNGIKWTLQTSPINVNWRSVCWIPELKLFCAVAYNTLIISFDGIEWKLKSVATGLWENICWSNELSLLCIVTHSGINKIITSNLQARLPTSYNIFNDPNNNIDQNGNWSIKLANIYNDQINITGNTKINNTLTISGTTTLLSNLLINGAVTINNNLIVDELIINNDLTTNSNIFVNGSLFVNDNIFVDNLIVDNTIAITESATLLSTLNVSGNTTIDGTLNVRDLVSDSITVNNSDTIVVLGIDTLFNDTTNLNCDINITGNLTVSGITTLNNGKTDQNGNWALQKLYINGTTISSLTNPLPNLDNCSLYVIGNAIRNDASTTWGISSDIRLKEDIKIADYNKCYQVMDKLDLKYYKWRDNIDILDRHKLGWIAQDIEQVFPKAINTIPKMYGLTDVKTINADQIYACMYGTIKQLMIENQNAKQEIKMLKDEIDKIKSFIKI